MEQYDGPHDSLLKAYKNSDMYEFASYCNHWNLAMPSFLVWPQGEQCIMGTGNVYLNKVPVNSQFWHCSKFQS